MIDILRQAIHAGAVVAMSHYGKITPLSEKNIAHDPSDWGKFALSQSDLETQESIMKVFIDSKLKIGIISEESGDKISALEKQFTHRNQFVDDKLTLVIDPIDGTGNYVSATPGHPKYEENKHNHKHWGVSGAIFRGSECIMGCIEYPALGLTLVTEKGKGTWINGEQIKVRGRSFGQDSIIRVSSTMREKRIKELYPRRGDDARAIVVRLLGYLGYPGVPNSDAYIGDYVSVYDLACCPLVYTEAGGLVVDQFGNNCNPFDSVVQSGDLRIGITFMFVPTRDFGYSLLAYLA